MKIIKWFGLSVTLLTVIILILGYLYLYVLPTGPEKTPVRPLSVGKDSFVMSAYKHTDRKTIRVWTYKPAQWTPKDSVLFVMHGMGRNAEDYLDAWSDIAERKRILLIAPEFASQFYRVITNDYQEGNLKSFFGWSNPESEWAFTVIENIFDRLNTANDFDLDEYNIFGHSAGGQFVQRMILMKPNARIKTAIAGNAGTYSFVDKAVPYPYGIGTVDYDLQRSFAKHLVILLGELDTDATQGKLDQSDSAMKQGAYRLERGKRFFKLSQESAKSQGVLFNWEQKVVPGVGHDYRAMSLAAATLL